MDTGDGWTWYRSGSAARAMRADGGMDREEAMQSPDERGGAPEREHNAVHTRHITAVHYNIYRTQKCSKLSVYDDILKYENKYQFAISSRKTDCFCTAEIAESEGHEKSQIRFNNACATLTLNIRCTITKCANPGR